MLPDTLQLMAGSLEAGYSLPQAVDTVAREAEDPVASEFNRAIVESRLGVPVDEALDNIATRTDCRDFAWVVMAIRIQREVGGNLAEILKNVAATLRERERLRRQVLVLSAEGRLSAVILAGLPIVFTLYLIMVRPTYIGVLITSFTGIMMAASGVLLMVIGILWMRRIVDVEV
jgi:tight adherence protein B